MPQNNQSLSDELHSAKIGWRYFVLSNWQKPFFLFAFFLILTLILYLPTAQSGFVTDVTGGIERIKNQPFSNIVQSFGFPALNQISILLFYVLYHVFGLNGWVWYLVFCSLHALNAYLIFSFFKQLFKAFKIEKALPIAFFGTLLFVLHPYQSEVLVWRACLNYLLVTAFMLLSLKQLLAYLQTEERKKLYYLQGFFILALFSFELSLMLPLLAISLYGIWSVLFKNKKQLLAFFTRITLPQIGLLTGYFLLHKLAFGNWVGHYGADTHLKFSMTEMVNTLAKYSLKYTFFVRSYTHTYKETIFNFCEHYGWIIVLLFGLLSLLIYKLRNGNFSTEKQLVFNKKTALLIFLIAGFILTLVPVLNLYFYWIQDVENDRYGYLPSVFGMMSLSFLFFQCPKLVRNVLLTLYLLTSLWILIPINQNWKKSTIVYEELIEDFRWYDKENVVILNIPDNYQGIYLFRIIGRGSGFKDAVESLYNRPIKGKIWEVAQYNMTQPTDGVSAEKTNPQQLKVTFNQWGNWFWRNGVGVGPTHKRSAYDIQFKGQFYLMDLKENLPNAVFIYQDGNKWKELEMN